MIVKVTGQIDLQNRLEGITLRVSLILQMGNGYGIIGIGEICERS